MFTSQSAGGKGPWVLVGVAMLVLALGSACSSTKTSPNVGTTASTTTAPTPAPTTSPPTTVALTALPITLTDADFEYGFSRELQLEGGAYTLSLSSNKPGPGVGVDLYRCGTSGGIVPGSGVYLGKGDTTDTEGIMERFMDQAKPLEAGCYTLFLSNLLDAKVTVKLAR